MLLVVPRSLGAALDSHTTPRLDSFGTVLYSLPFRTDSLKRTVQRPVGSVGVEALPGQQFVVA